MKTKINKTSFKDHLYCGKKDCPFCGISEEKNSKIIESALKTLKCRKK